MGQKLEIFNVNSDCILGRMGDDVFLEIFVFQCVLVCVCCGYQEKYRFFSDCYYTAFGLIS